MRFTYHLFVWPKARRSIFYKREEVTREKALEVPFTLYSDDREARLQKLEREAAERGEAKISALGDVDLTVEAQS